MTRRSLAIGVGLLLAGCATTSGITTDPARIFILAISRDAGVTPPKVVVLDTMPVATVAFYARRTNTIVVARWILGDTAWDIALAHELGHVLLKHNVDAVARSEIPALETAANAKAVELLVHYRGFSETVALHRVYTFMRRAMNREPAPGHAPPCDEITDLLARFPQHRALWQTWECAPAATP